MHWLLHSFVVEGHDSVAASEPSDSKGQSRACDTSAAGGSITGSSKAAAGGTNLGTGGEGADDDDDDDDKEGKEDGNISDSRGAEGEKKPPVPVAVGSQGLRVHFFSLHPLYHSLWEPK